MVQLPFRTPNLGPRTRRGLRYVAVAFAAMVVFVFALQLTFPYERVRDKVVDALAEKYEVTIGSVERGIKPGRVYFNAVTLRTRQTQADEVVTTFYMKRLEIDVGILALIGGTISVDIEAQIGAGNLSGTLAIGKFGRGDIAAKFSGDALPGDALPMRAALGLPMTGKIAFDVDLVLPMERSKMGKTAVNWQKARGTFALACPSGCTFGDGKTRLKPLLKNTRNQVMVGEGIDFGKVQLDSLVAKASIGKGKLTVDRFDATSKDGELKIDYTMTLEKEFGESMVAGCLRFKGSDDLMRREPKTFAAIQTTGAELRDDGLFHIRLTDRFKDMKRLNAECGPSTQVPSGENFDRPDRPNLTIQPDDISQPNTATTAPPPPPPTPTPTPMETSMETPMETPPSEPAPTPAPMNPTGAPDSDTRGDVRGEEVRGGDGVRPGMGGNGGGGPAGGPASLQPEPPRERPGEQGSAMPPPE
jgi:type II secretion system protein N